MSPNFTLKQLRYFVTTAELGSVAEAARTLFVSQPSISTALAKLEALLGVQLFLRSPAHGLTLTSSGEALLIEARELLAHAQDVDANAKGLVNEVLGTLRVGCFTTFAPRFMPGLLAGFAERYPGARVKLSEGTQDRLLGELQRGRLEAAIVYDVDVDADLER